MRKTAKNLAEKGVCQLTISSHHVTGIDSGTAFVGGKPTPVDSTSWIETGKPKRPATVVEHRAGLTNDEVTSHG